MLLLKFLKERQRESVKVGFAIERGDGVDKNAQNYEIRALLKEITRQIEQIIEEQGTINGTIHLLINVKFLRRF